MKDEAMKKIDNWNELKESLSKYKNKVTFHPKFLFRGQADTSWSLEPSFTRVAKKKNLNRKKALQLELDIMNKFSISARNILALKNTISLTLAGVKSSHGPGIDFPGWFVVMQHYSAPTRTLDWTCSPWVALYFACCEEEDSDGAIWIAEFTKVVDYAKSLSPGGKVSGEMISDSTSPDILNFATAFCTNERLEAQQGRFSLCTNPLSDHKDIMESADALCKIEVPKLLKETVMKELYHMNISAKTLFPGIDDLGKSISEYCSLWDESSIIKQ